MGTPFLGELKIVPYSFAPRNWALCNGQLLPINQNQPLFSLLGTMYGGNGQTNFALPDLRGRVPIHVGSGFIQGQAGGEEAHTVTQSEMPAHTHFLNVTTANATDDTPSSGVVLATAALDLYRPPTSLTAMDPGTVGTVGGSQPHLNNQPYLVLNYIICLIGAFPSRN
ncbi:MAG TPA: tail fiber protein [Croceibacterium sp.]|nr:tail fiber protein [Croceibacterium sp.]